MSTSTTLSLAGISRLVSWWLFLALVWLLLISPLSLPELVAGLIAAAIAVTGLTVVGVRGRLRYTFRPQGLARVLRRTPPRILRDALAVARGLAGTMRGAPVEGRVVSLPFDPGQPNDPRDAARRALVLTALSAAPNSCVVEIDASKQAVVVHQLIPQPSAEPLDRRWPL